MTDLQARIKTMPFHIHKRGSESTNTTEKCIVIPINPCFEVQGSSKHLAYVTSHDVLLGNPTPTLPKTKKTTGFKDLLTQGAYSLFGITSSGINISITKCERQ